jgi:hypothetical protein
MRTIADDDRAVSETTGVAVLILVMLVTTVSVGLSVIIVNDEGESDFDVRFQYSSDLEQMTIFYEGEGEIRAGDVVVQGPAKNVTWAELADVESGATVEPGDRPVFLNDASVYGSNVGSGDVIRVTYSPADGESVTRTWDQSTSEDDSSGDDGSGTGGPETAIGSVPAIAAGVVSGS